jgi:hypothetical protein
MQHRLAIPGGINDAVRTNMDLEITATGITVFLNNPSRDIRHRVNLRSLLVIGRDQARILVSATIKSIAGKAYRTQLSYLRDAVGRFGQYLQQRRTASLPRTQNDWEHLLLDWFSWYLSHGGSNASLSSRTRQWADPVTPWVRLMIEEKVIPYDVIVPATRMRKEVVHYGTPLRPALIGEKPAPRMEQNVSINKTLAGPIFWKAEEEYLKEVELTLNTRQAALTQALDDYFLRLVKDYRTGRNLMRRVSLGEVAHRKKNDDWQSSTLVAQAKDGFAGKYLITHPNAPDSTSWLLVILRELLSERVDQQCLSTRALQSHPAIYARFPSKRTETPIQLLEEKTALQADQLARFSRMSLILRFLGVLNAVDMAVASAILIQEHPNFNPCSLFDAKLLSQKGNPYLVMQNDNNTQIFSVDKPRAGERKYAVLSRRAARVIRHVVRVTQPVRELLERSNSELWRHLFLGMSCGSKGKLGKPELGPAQLTSEIHPSLLRYYPELAEIGLVQGTLDFAKIRATQGVLTWFETGSVQMASRKLGNTYRVALQNYIPKPLLRLAIERTVRRFQNTLIFLAASDEDYVLEATDFRSLDELHKFLMQLLQEHMRGSSPIADRLYCAIPKSIEGDFQNPVDCPANSSLLSINLSSSALAVLYAYREVVLQKLSKKEREILAKKSGTPQESLIDLANLLHHAAESESIGEALADSLQLNQLKKVHAQAKGRVGNYTPAILSIVRSTTCGEPK